jgi:hypothetical protein
LFNNYCRKKRFEKFPCTFWKIQASKIKNFRRVKELMEEKIMKKNLYRMLLIPLMLMLAVSVAQGKGNKGGKDKGDKGKPTQKRVTLTPSGSDTDASGFAMIMFNPNKKKSDQTFQVKVEKVAGSSSFTIVVDGNMIDTFTTTPGGTFEAIYETDPKGSHKLLPEILKPVTNIKIVEILDKDGKSVLKGDFTAANGGGGGNDFEKEFKLNPTSADHAKGKAKAEQDTEGTTTSSKLEIEVENLNPSASYKVFANGTELGAFTTDAAGKAKVTFSSAPQTGELPLPTGFDVKTITLIEIKDSTGAVVLTSAQGSSNNQTITLTSTGTIASAAGNAEKRTTGDQGITIQVTGLTPFAVFLVKIDGKLAGAINTDSAGSGKLELAADAKGGCKAQLPASVTLSTAKLIEITNDTGGLVLNGMFQ